MAATALTNSATPLILLQHNIAVFSVHSLSRHRVAPLDKAISMIGEARLAMNTDKPTEPVMIRWTDH